MKDSKIRGPSSKNFYSEFDIEIDSPGMYKVKSESVWQLNTS